MQTLHVRTVYLTGANEPKIESGINFNKWWLASAVKIDQESKLIPCTVGFEITKGAKPEFRLASPSARPSSKALVLFVYYSGQYTTSYGRRLEGFSNVLATDKRPRSNSEYEELLSVMAPGEQIVVQGKYTYMDSEGSSTTRSKFVIEWDGKDLVWYAGEPRSSQWRSLSKVKTSVLAADKPDASAKMLDDVAALAMIDPSKLEHAELTDFIETAISLSENLQVSGDADGAVEVLKLALVAAYLSPGEDSATTIKQRKNIEERLIKLQQ
jgi:hypothetical protein